MPRCLHSFPTRRSSDLAEEEARLVQLMWEYRDTMSDFDCDVLDFFVSRWLRRSRGLQDYVVVRLDDVLAMRGISKQKRSEEHTSELQSPMYLVCRLLLE